MQGLADGYFIVPLTIGHYLAQEPPATVETDHAAFADAERAVRARIRQLLDAQGREPATYFHRELGHLMWESCGMSRDAGGLAQALEHIPRLRHDFWRNVRVAGTGEQLNVALEHAGRVADFLKFAEVMCLDALNRDESCGGHFREEHQTVEGEAVRDDERFAHVSAWAFKGDDSPPVEHREALCFDALAPTTRSYR
jgi:succinate dehydrogenase / fumarate reductase flavoprotein subunit